jgi:hypothetical protein
LDERFSQKRFCSGYQVARLKHFLGEVGGDGIIDME